MKNFSELLATRDEASVLIRIILVPEVKNGAPHLILRMNDKVFVDRWLHDRFVFTAALPWLTQPIKIEVEMQGKEYDPDKETAIVIDQLSIDYFKIIPNYTHYVDYQNDHGINEPTSYLGFNGVWTFDTKVPFYNWKHQATGQGWLLSPN